MENIKVGIIEDERTIRESMATLIDGSSGFSCKHVFEAAEEAISRLPSLNLDVVMVDIHLPKKSGIECIEILRPLCPQTQFMMCTSFEDNDSIFNALRAGAAGYISKTTNPVKILEAIVEVHRGGSFMSGNIARKIISSFHHKKEDNPELDKLSVREKEILDLLAKGIRYKEIADTLFISVETVRTHIRNIYQKLEVNTRMEAILKVYPK